MELLEQLDGIVMRDQREPPKGQRKALNTAAKAIRADASEIVKRIHHLRRALADFGQAIEPRNWSAVMLYEVFDIPYVPSTAVDAPEVFAELRSAMAARDSAWTELSINMEALSRLPVRARMSTNKVRNHALEQALIACRVFWLRHSKRRGWSRSILSHPETLKSYEPDELVGMCERFVVDMLTASGIHFTLPSLNGAWSALDKRLGSQRGTANQ